MCFYHLSFCSLTKGITPKIRMLGFVLINIGLFVWFFVCFVLTFYVFLSSFVLWLHKEDYAENLYVVFCPNE